MVDEVLSDCNRCNFLRGIICIWYSILLVSSDTRSDHGNETKKRTAEHTGEKMTDRIEEAERELARAILEKEGRIDIFKLKITADNNFDCPVVNVKCIDDNGIKSSGVTYKNDKLKDSTMREGQSISANIKTPLADYSLTIVRVR